MVHSSLKSLGPQRPSPEELIGALREVLGARGTLLMPALSYKQQPHNIHKTAETPSNVGVLPECFRRSPGTIRSLHPTHSVCGVGPAAEELLAGHEQDDTPCGPCSPFRRILDREAKIVMLGCGLGPNTAMHALEEFVEPPYLFGDTCEYQITTAAGKQYSKKYRTHDFEGWNQRYDRVSLLSETNLFVTGAVLDASAFVINTKELKRSVLSKLREDPLFFVDKINANKALGGARK
jgi:aminoglycoside 3-N-acetyltransferase